MTPLTFKVYSYTEEDNLDDENIECTVDNKEFCFRHGMKSEIVLFLFLTSGLTAIICLWLLVLPNSNNEIIHVL